MPSYSYDRDTLTTLLGPAAIEAVNRWIRRGDGVAVYENKDLGHPALGHKIFVSFGSTEAQLEVEEPPERLPDGLAPDTTGGINWRYCLIGTYRGEEL